MSPTTQHLFSQIINDQTDHGLVLFQLRTMSTPFVGKVSLAHSAHNTGHVYKATVVMDTPTYDEQALTTIYFGSEEVVTFGKVSAKHLDDKARGLLTGAVA